METLYNFDWIHQEAKQLGFGKLVLELSVKDGVIHMVEILETRKRRSLEDIRKKPNGKEILLT